MAMINAPLPHIPVRIFTGSLLHLPNDGRLTGMYKQPVKDILDIGVEGFMGDHQADRRVHGGPEKAVHLYPAEHYGALAQRFPEVAAQLVPGSLGENLSTVGLTEANICIGDIFRLGSARLQVCQPRSPCWKIDCRFGADGIAAFIADTGLTGWYWRVLEPGQACEGQELVLIERPNNAIALRAAMEIWRTHRPAPAELERVAGARGIAGGWRQKFIDRANWLRRQPELPPPSST